MNRPKVFFIIIYLCFLAAAFIRINNNFRFNPACGYDASGHLAYIFQIKSGWGIPLANEGWCTFHPPLYYFIMSGIWKILGNKSPWPVHIILRLFSTLMNLAIALLVFLSIRLLWPKKSLILLLGICFFISGGFYVRNMLLFGRLFVLGQDYPVVDELIKQQPLGERRCSDFLGFDFRIFYNPIVLDPQDGISTSRSRYVWSLVYSNFWFDSFSHFFLLKWDTWRERIGIILLWLGIFPTLFFFLEIGKETALNFKKKMSTPAFPLRLQRDELLREYFNCIREYILIFSRFSVTERSKIAYNTRPADFQDHFISKIEIETFTSPLADTFSLDLVHKSIIITFHLKDTLTLAI